MYQRVKAYVEEQHMLEKKDRVIVGVSGGADSVCLLFVLTKLRDERQKSGDGTLEITAVHVHHGLRGDSADADERYVRKICDAWNVPLVVYHKNIRELAKCWNMSEEEAGRKARREAFLEVRNQYSDVPCDNAQYVISSPTMLSVPMADKRARKVLGKLRWHTTEMMRPRPCYFICAGEQMSGDLAGLRRCPDFGFVHFLI